MAKKDDNENQDVQETRTAPIIYGLVALTIIGAWYYSDMSKSPIFG